jgi:hypothetical protein
MWKVITIIVLVPFCSGLFLIVCAWVTTSFAKYFWYRPYMPHLGHQRAEVREEHWNPRSPAVPCRPRQNQRDVFL